jgi:hypothetical protein
MMFAWIGNPIFAQGLINFGESLQQNVIILIFNPVQLNVKCKLESCICV